MLISAAMVLSVGVALYAVTQLARRASASNDHRFIDLLLADAGRLLREHRRQPNHDLVPDLQRALQGGPLPPSLNDLVRIDYEIARTDSTAQCRCTVSAAIRDGRDVVILEAVRMLAWERIPASMRAEFIRRNVPAQAFVLLDSAPASS